MKKKLMKNANGNNQIFFLVWRTRHPVCNESSTLLWHALTLPRRGHAIKRIVIIHLIYSIKGKILNEKVKESCYIKYPPWKKTMMVASLRAVVIRTRVTWCIFRLFSEKEKTRFLYIDDATYLWKLYRFLVKIIFF